MGMGATSRLALWVYFPGPSAFRSTTPPVNDGTLTISKSSVRSANRGKIGSPKFGGLPSRKPLRFPLARGKNALPENSISRTTHENKRNERSAVSLAAQKSVAEGHQRSP